ncbi:MAG TPA: methyltransferase domain-containing protein [Vicinamibacterales bacterium]|jgi:ubiquinone/menaquinone biosynthesis C-methylase UbiE
MASAQASVRTIWALGDYHRFATATVWTLGPVLVEVCRISAGQRVLDVAAGTGNVAIRAAQAGATVVALDVTPEHFEAGRRAAGEAGVDLEWIEGDATALPFADAEFDVVTSCFGAMFAADHQATARELLRVCRPGGVIGMMNFAPRGAAGDFFQLLSAYAPPPPPGALSPLLWGTEDHVRRLFGDRVQSLNMTRCEYVESASSARQYLELFKYTFGPMVAIYASLKDQPRRAEASASAVTELDEAFLRFTAQWNRGAPDGPVQLPYEYLLVIGRTLGA